ncbi:glutamine--fructose-6-phosphate transaminase (isomerizing) [Candidatus Pacearchaeota archaeon]|nr:glutamine--fructose-6-phosphate transaminase (isomerizing) [Candidatus Pacearchaeota archaeon]
MCGIIGYIGNEDNALEALRFGLEKLEYRGYDSCGIALASEENIEVFRTLGSPQNLPSSFSRLFRCGIGHNRWATHGKVTVENAHPHKSEDEEVYLVHNGVVENSDEIKKSLAAGGIKFTSDTDSEVLVNLISHYYKKRNTHSSSLENNHLKAIKSALNSVEGTYGLAILFKDSPDIMYGARRSSPLIIGVGKDEHFIASDTNALPAHVDKVVYLDDDQIVSLSSDSFIIHSLKNNKIVKGFEKTKKIKIRNESTSKGNFSTYMEKEIFEQSKTIKDTLRGRFTDDFSSVKLGGLNLNKQINRVLFLGCGTAYHAGLLGKYYMENIAKVPASVEFSSEYKYKNNPTEDGTLVVGISQSGETIDTLSALQEAQSKDLDTIAITNVVSSSIAREVPQGVYQRVGPEISVASTKAFTSQVTLLLMLSILVGRKNNLSLIDSKKYINQIRLLPELIDQTLELQDSISHISGLYQLMHSIDFLGRQYMYPIALEGALKLKELSYIDSHGYPSGEIKHGPLATVCRGRRCIFLAPQESIKDKNISSMKEIKARGGDIILLKQKGQEFPKDCYDQFLEVPKCQDILLPIVSVVPLQIFAMQMARRKGLNIDKPRNLAKSVTVE